MYPAKLYPVGQDLHIIPNFLVARLYNSRQKTGQSGLELVNLSGLEQYQLAPDHHQDSSDGKVVRWIAEFYNGKRETIRISPRISSTGTDVFEQQGSSNSGPGPH